MSEMWGAAWDINPPPPSLFSSIIGLRFGSIQDMATIQDLHKTFDRRISTIPETVDDLKDIDKHAVDWKLPPSSHHESSMIISSSKTDHSSTDDSHDDRRTPSPPLLYEADEKFQALKSSPTFPAKSRVHSVSPDGDGLHQEALAAMSARPRQRHHRRRETGRDVVGMNVVEKFGRPASELPPFHLK